MAAFFEFRICPNNDFRTPVTHECLDRNLLPLADGSGYRMYMSINDQVGFHNTTLRLPKGLSCTQCVLQWRWHTGNSWGTDEDGHSCIGCGAQEEFYGCSDVAIRPRDVGVDPPSHSQNISVVTTSRTLPPSPIQETTTMSWPAVTPSTTTTTPRPAMKPSTTTTTSRPAEKPSTTTTTSRPAEKPSTTSTATGSASQQPNTRAMKRWPGNSWGTDEDGYSCIGCGAQEEFYGCSDVAIRTRDVGVDPPSHSQNIPVVTTPRTLPPSPIQETTIMSKHVQAAVKPSTTTTTSTTITATGECVPAAGYEGN